MYRVRTVKTSSGAVAVQVVEYFKNKRTVLLHVGSAANEEEISDLKKSALSWIEKNDRQKPLFPLVKNKAESSLISLDKCEYLGFRYQLFYDVFWSLSVKFKFHLIAATDAKTVKILNDLVIARIAAPSSKLESFEFISDYFGITHGRRDFYRTLVELPKLKSEVEVKIISVAKKNFGFNFSLVFYDLTTLYFESFETDNLRKIGFSKDNKASNPQIMIGLLVNDLGFPISYQLDCATKSCVSPKYFFIPTPQTSRKTVG